MKRARSSFRIDVAFWIIRYLLVAALLPVVNMIGKWLQPIDAFLISSMLTVGLICGEVFFSMKRLIEAEEIKVALWETRKLFDNKLSIIRKCFHDIVEENEVDPDLFQKYFEHQAAHFEEIIQRTSKNHELAIDQRHFANTTIALECFRGEHDDIFRAVHLFKDNEFFTKGFPKQYSKQIAEKVKRGKIRHVKRLLIYQDEQELHSDLSLRIIKYHETQTNYLYRLMSHAEYAELLNDSEELKDYPDFGIYGVRYLYRAEVSKLDHIRGVWTKDKEKMRLYTDFFDDCFGTIFAHSAADLDIDLSEVIPL